MASYLPSLMQTNTLDYENLSIKSDRFNPITVEVDHDSEISKWLKLENDPLPLPPIGNSSSTFSNIFSLPTVGGHVNNTSSTTNNGYLTNASSASTSTSMVSNQNLGNVNMNNHNNHVQASSTVNDSLFNYLAPSSSVPTSPPMTQHNSNRSCTSELQHENTQFQQFNTQNPFTNSTTESISDLTLENPFSGFSSFSNASNTFSSYSCNNSNTNNNNNSINNGNTGISNESSQYSNFNYSPQYSNFNSFSTTPCTTTSTTSTSSSKQFNTQQSGYNVQQKNSNASKQSQQFNSNQFNQNHFQFAPNTIPDLHSLATPQLYQLFAQFQQIIKNQTQSPSSSASSLPNSLSSSPVNCDHDTNDDKKNKKSVRAPIRRVRQTRPKVVEAKGAVQCKGKNRKKGIQCRNAALMEYIGPRPIYCAEHIELDPKSLYEKCKSSYQKEVGDNKGCKEVVLKEFGVCYKHYTDLIVDLVSKKDVDTVKFHHERIAELLNQLEREASAAKKKDGDLYQRKNKLIPKFQEMKKTINKAVETLEINIHEYSPSHYSDSHYHSHTHSLDSSPAQHLPMSSVQEHFMDVSRGKETGDIAPMNPDAHIHSYLDIDVDSPTGLLVLSDHGSDNDTDDSERDIVDVFTDVSDD